MANKTAKRTKQGSPAISANVQWLVLSGLAALAIVAVFVFGVGNTNQPGGGHSGAPAAIAAS